jgi:hypothetical protein
MTVARDRMVARFAARKRRPGPPTFARAPRQDSFGNPTTKKPGDVGTAIGKHGKWLDMDGRFKPHSSKDWR